jgi:hypothetical protein
MNRRAGGTLTYGARIAVGGLSGADFALPQSLTRKFESLRLDKDRFFPRSLSIASLLP